MLSLRVTLGMGDRFALWSTSSLPSISRKSGPADTAKVAAKMGSRYTDALVANETVVARNVTRNLFDRHIKPLFLD